MSRTQRLTDYTKLSDEQQAVLAAIPSREERSSPEEPMVEQELSLDEALDVLSDEMDEETDTQPVTSPQDQMRADILATLAKREGAPDEEQVNAWKDKLGDDAVHVFALDPKNVYIYTHLTLGQWEKVQDITRKSANQSPDMQAKVDKILQENVIRSVVLWPKLESDFFVKCRAGLPGTLYELVLMQSYFLRPEHAITLTTQL